MLNSRGHFRNTYILYMKSHMKSPIEIHTHSHINIFVFFSLQNNSFLVKNILKFKIKYYVNLLTSRLLNSIETIKVTVKRTNYDHKMNHKS